MRGERVQSLFPIPSSRYRRLNPSPGHLHFTTTADQIARVFDIFKGNLLIMHIDQMCVRFVFLTTTNIRNKTWTTTKKWIFLSLLHQFDLSVKCDVNRWLAYWHSRNLFCPKGKRWTLNHLHNNWNVHYLPVQSFFFHSLFASFVFVL